MKTSSNPPVELRSAETAPDIEAVRALFTEYQASLDIDLCFQGFANEVRDLPGDYAEPTGALVVAFIEGQAAGCCGLRSLPNSDHLNACEMKRLFVRPEFRGFGIGRLLVERILMQAQMAGYATMLLDTLSDMETARALYQEAGFVEVAPYYHNPIPGAHYLMVDLSTNRPHPTLG